MKNECTQQIKKRRRRRRENEHVVYGVLRKITY